ncbi:uncharacterized protein TEOVI_000381900 [Trypanosoma equiperdum]|uniref:Elongin-C n=4 Tax=Trypanozoon TaxID=39700 RepID=Q38ED0_TRYB2|nr:hypothetical protein, conserved [Trypanosoma brucei gambiense DAL972]XP_827170.1 hypothetical protein, conserved [Trypanosoma brucei brucei TREU927]RHW70199.1 hypothetical protein DPX39_090044400 [Trypanosoma brucei equiperdum]SCU72243.1 hypothetical protein, conserved [Trypanosoma equiperdum]EAN76840.1 hypothetical protein, conserved [Trypanosoma brucei brucei TREU927]CBH14380.1 hypothetical protein, conserved [Trypanosoma brucei gambiense DAL972]|eukprot:XP_011776646.1 hypothetical protein, conserved [Trypanosoma brucei gambiense DAL972]
MQRNWVLLPQTVRAGDAPKSSAVRTPTRPLPYVCLKSNDGMEFVLPEVAARQSKMLAMLLDAVYSLPERGGFAEPTNARGEQHTTVHASNNIGTMPCIPLEVLSGRILELVCRYLVQRSTSDVNSTDEFALLGELNPTSSSDQDIVLGLLMASDYLDC